MGECGKVGFGRRIEFCLGVGKGVESKKSMEQKSIDCKAALN